MPATAAQEREELTDRLKDDAHKENNLETKTNELLSTLKTSLFLGGGLAATYLTCGASLLLDVASMGAGFAIGKYFSNKKIGEKTTAKKLAQEGITGGILGGYLAGLFKLVGLESLSALGKIAFTYASIPLFMLTHYITDHFVRNYNPLSALYNIITRPFSLAKEIYQKNIKPTFWKAFKKTMLWMAPIYSATVFLPRQYLMPAYAVEDGIYGYWTAEKTGKGPVKK